MRFITSFWVISLFLCAEVRAEKKGQIPCPVLLAGAEGVSEFVLKNHVYPDLQSLADSAWKQFSQQAQGSQNINENFSEWLNQNLGQVIESINEEDLKLPKGVYVKLWNGAKSEFILSLVLYSDQKYSAQETIEKAAYQEPLRPDPALVTASPHKELHPSELTVPTWPFYVFIYSNMAAVILSSEFSLIYLPVSSIVFMRSLNGFLDKSPTRTQ